MKILTIVAASAALASVADADVDATDMGSSPPSFVNGRSLQGGGCNDCVVDGVGYCRFQSYPDPNCLPNVCRCRPGEVDPCTKNECTRNCAAQNKKVCAHDGNFYCAGDLFYDTSCMTNTCTCNADGTVTCGAKNAGDCKVECYTDDDCTTVVRTRSAQPDLHPLCGCEARSALWEIASSYDECLGQDVIAGSSCANGRCDGNSCQGQRAVCKNRKCELISPCKKDVKTCPGGAKVRRNAANNCEFDPCPAPPPSSNEPENENAPPSDSDPSDKPSFVFGKLCFDASGDNYIAPCLTSTSSYCVSETFTGDDGCSSCLCANSQGQTICKDDACSSMPPPPPPQPPKEFTYKREKMKTCEWLGKNPDEAIAIICRTRVKEPSARASCPRTCALSQVGRLNEAQNEYLHRKKTKKTCDWLKVRADRARICSKNRNARGNCPLEC